MPSPVPVPLAGRLNRCTDRLSPSSTIDETDVRLLLLLVTRRCARRSRAQQRPLVTEDPETIGAGNILIEGGFDSQREVVYPASGLTGNLLRLPTLGVSFGFSSILELQIDGGLYNRLNITSIEPAPLSDKLELTGDDTNDVEDLVVATKIRVVSEGPGRPSFGVRLATKLPIASNESGLGPRHDGFLRRRACSARPCQSVRVVGNFGLGILSDPVEGDRQNDVLTYGLSSRGRCAGARGGRRDQRAASTLATSACRPEPRRGRRFAPGSASPTPRFASMAG